MVQAVAAVVPGTVPGIWGGSGEGSGSCGARGNKGGSGGLGRVHPEELGAGKSRICDIIRDWVLENTAGCGPEAAVGPAGEGIPGDVEGGTRETRGECTCWNSHSSHRDAGRERVPGSGAGCGGCSSTRGTRGIMED